MARVHNPNPADLALDTWHRADMGLEDEYNHHDGLAYATRFASKFARGPGLGFGGPVTTYAPSTTWVDGPGHIVRSQPVVVVTTAWRNKEGTAGTRAPILAPVVGVPFGAAPTGRVSKRVSFATPPPVVPPVVPPVATPVVPPVVPPVATPVVPPVVPPVATPVVPPVVTPIVPPVVPPVVTPVVTPVDTFDALRAKIALRWSTVLEQVYRLSKDSITTRVKGIQNAGNSCFIAAFLQLFMRTPIPLYMVNGLAGPKDGMVQACVDFVNAYKRTITEGPVGTNVIHAFRKQLKKGLKKKDGGVFVENDVAELASDVMGKLHISTCTVFPSSFSCAPFLPESKQFEQAAVCSAAQEGVSVLSANFSFIVGTQLACSDPILLHDWKFKRDTNFVFFCRQPSAGCTLQALISDSFTPTPIDWVIDESAGTKCTSATEKTVLCSAPPYLWVDLGRGGQAVSSAPLVRNNFKFTFGPEPFDVIIPFFSETATSSSSRYANYRLIGFCAHHGVSFAGGHWYAYAKVGVTWYKFNDSSLPEVQSGDWFDQPSVQEEISFCLLQRQSDTTAEDTAVFQL